jgi:hypothetical protein
MIDTATTTPIMQEQPQASSSRSSISSSSTLHEQDSSTFKSLPTPSSEDTSFTLSRQPTLTHLPLPKSSPIYPGEGTEASPYLVDFPPDDLENPYNWASTKKWRMTAIIALSTLCISFASSSYSAAIQSIQEKFDASTEVGISGISVYVLGMCTVPFLHHLQYLSTIC